MQPAGLASQHTNYPQEANEPFSSIFQALKLYVVFFNYKVVLLAFGIQICQRER